MKGGSARTRVAAVFLFLSFFFVVGGEGQREKERQTAFFFFPRRARRAHASALERPASSQKQQSSPWPRELSTTERPFSSNSSPWAQELVFSYRLSTKKRETRPRQGREGISLSPFFRGGGDADSKVSFVSRIAARHSSSWTGLSRPQLSRSGILTHILETTWTRDGRTKGSRGRDGGRLFIGSGGGSYASNEEREKKPDVDDNVQKPSPAPSSAPSPRSQQKMGRIRDKKLTKGQESKEDGEEAGHFR